MNLLESMEMVKRAWRQVSPETIKNCWNHTKIQREAIPSITIRRPAKTWKPIHEEGWDIVADWASEAWTLPEVEERLKERLGDRFIYSDWKNAFDAVLSAENDVVKAMDALEKLKRTLQGLALTDTFSSSNTDMLLNEEIPKTDQQIEAEKNLTMLVADLKERKRISGSPRDIEELIDPEEERVVGGEEDYFMGNDSEIVAKVCQESTAPIEIIDSDSDSNEDGDPPPTTPLPEMIDMCAKLEKASVFHEAKGGMELASMLRRYRFELQQVANANKRQTTLAAFFSQKQLL
jgi:hypothetical protein